MLKAGKVIGVIIKRKSQLEFIALINLLLPLTSSLWNNNMTSRKPYFPYDILEAS